MSTTSGLRHRALLLGASVLAVLPVSIARAGVVGTGTPGSCTQSALITQITAGGTVTFDCGGAATIFLNTTIAATNPAAVVDGGGLITLDGSSANFPIVWVNGSPTALADITFRNLTFANGSYTTGLVAGAAIVNTGNTTLDTVTFTNNSAPFGGAIMQESCVSCLAPSLTVTNSTFTGNTASSSGGAINVGGGTLTVTSSTFSGNTGGYGGAIELYLNSGQTQTVASFTASTFSGNHTANDGGAIYQQGSLGPGGGLTVTNCTFTGNTAGGGAATTAAALSIGPGSLVSSATIAGNTAAGGVALYATGGAVVRSTIVAGNTGLNCNLDGALGAGSVSNLQFGDGSCTGFATGNPNLGALAANGGPTLTMLPGPGSAAVDAVPLAGCTEAVDQRGLPRPSPPGGSCDIGAVEVQQAAGTINLTIAKQAPASVTSGHPLTYTLTYGNTGTGDAASVVIRDTVPTGTTFVSATNGGALQGGDVVWAVGMVAAGTSGQTVSFTVNVAAASGTVTNGTYSIQSGTQPAVAGPPVQTTVVPVPPPAAAIPALGSTGLVLFALSLAAAGFLVTRRRF